MVLILLGIALLSAAAVWWGRGRRARGAADVPARAESANSRAVAVTLAVVETHDVPIYLEGLGTATPLSTVTVKSLVDGRLERVFFEEGQRVKKGEVIGQVDPRPFLIALHQAEAAFTRDEAQLRNAELNLQRYRALRSQNLIPEQQLTDQKAAHDQLVGVVKADQALIDNAKLSLDYARIKAPADGVTGVRLVDPGNIVHASDTTGIVIITQLDPMGVLFTLPQDDLERVSRAMAAGPVPVEAYSRDGLSRLGAGRLELIDNQVIQNTATIRLKAVLPNPDRALWPNQFVKARLLLETRKGAVTVPAAAVQRGPQGTFVYVVDSENRAHVRAIVVETTVGALSLVTSGVRPGDRVVVEGTNHLREGAQVSPRPAAGAAPSQPAPSGAPGPAPPGAPGPAPPGAPGPAPPGAPGPMPPRVPVPGRGPARPRVP